MNRRRKIIAVAVAVVTVAAAGTAYAAFGGKLKGSVNATKLSIAWAPATAATNDGAGQLDPTTPGMAPTRDTNDIGSSTMAATASLLTVTSSGVYDSYRFSATADATITGGGAAVFKVQKIRLTGAPVGAVITPTLHPGVCGVTLSSTPATVTFDIQYVDVASAPATFSLGVEIDIVSGAAYNAAACNPWS